MTFDKNDLNVAIANLSMLRFFPPDEATRAAIQALLVRICPDRVALLWLVDEFVNRIGEWRGSLELRAVLATRWLPADGIDADSQIPGYTPADGEAKTQERHLQIKAQEKVGGWIEDPESRDLIGGIGKKLLQ